MDVDEATNEDVAGEVEGVTTASEVAAKAVMEVEESGGEVEEIKVGVDDVGTEIITSRILSVCGDVLGAGKDVVVEASEV